MDVSPWISRLVCYGMLLSLTLVFGCGNRFDLSKERGRRARIDEANFFLSKGNCTAAIEAIDPLYHSPHVDDEVRIIKASAHACAGTFNLFNVLSSIGGGSNNIFSTAAKSLSNTQGDGARAALYQAVDALTRNGVLLEASARSTSVNNYMVFIQFGVISAILRNYGNPLADGSKVVPLVYTTGSNPPGEMSDLDACALAAGISMLSNSFSHSSLSDSGVSSAVTSINNFCVSIGLSSCSDISKTRTDCDGTNAASVTAQSVVAGVDGAW